MTNSSNGTAVISSVLCAWRQSRSSDGSATECPAVDARVPLNAAYKRAGAAAVVELCQKLRTAPVGKYEFSVSQLNSMGYLLMRRGDEPGALAIFELNAIAFHRTGMSTTPSVKYSSGLARKHAQFRATASLST